MNECAELCWVDIWVAEEEESREAKLPKLSVSIDTISRTLERVQAAMRNTNNDVASLTRFLGEANNIDEVLSSGPVRSAISDLINYSNPLRRASR